jgi:hypothetical protein
VKPGIRAQIGKPGQIREIGIGIDLTCQNPAYRSAGSDWKKKLTWLT